MRAAVLREYGEPLDVTEVDALGIATTCRNSVLSLGTHSQHV